MAVNQWLSDLGLTDPRWPWAPALVVLGVLAVVIAQSWRGRRPPRAPEVVLAHTARLRSLGRYRELVQRRRTSGLLFAGAALLVIAGSALVLARPQTQSVETRDPRGRDLMLCLDASYSMDADNEAVIGQVRRIVAGLHGDRVGLVIWSAAAVQVFPLTDDYGFIDAELDRAQAAFAGDDHSRFFAGIDYAVRRSSVIGDGLVSCVNRFDPAAADRTKAVIVSSDNDPHGRPAYSLPEAASYAAERQVLVYGIGATALDQEGRGAAREELADATATTGGTFELLSNEEGAERILDRIDALEKARATEPPRTVFRDTPYLGMGLAGLGVGSLLVAWLVAWRSARRQSPRRGQP